MNRVSAKKYIDGVLSIYEEKPVYELGHDGSDGKCDCIGMCRGGLIRAGVTGIKNMNGTNQAARKTIKDLQELKSENQLCVGDVVLKTRDKDDATLPLPDRYRKGGADYDPAVGETNFTHIGTVTQVNPLVITHMTSPTAKQDKSIKGWKYFGELPYVEYEVAPEPQPEPEPMCDTAIVVAEHGKTVKLRAKPSTSCSLYWDVPVGSVVIVDDWKAEWSIVTWNHLTGYMMTKFLQSTDGDELYTVIIPHLTLSQANALLEMYPGSTKESERG